MKKNMKLNREVIRALTAHQIVGIAGGSGAAGVVSNMTRCYECVSPPAAAG